MTADTVQSFSGQRSIAPDSQTDVTLVHSNSSSLALKNKKDNLIPDLLFFQNQSINKSCIIHIRSSSKTSLFFVYKKTF